MTAQNRFEDRLLEELRQVVEERPASGKPRRAPVAPAGRWPAQPVP